MRLERLHHVAVIVSDYQRAREFYVEKLGFPVLRENFREERGDWKLDLRFGDGSWRFSPSPARRSAPAIRRPGACAIWPSGWRISKRRCGSWRPGGFPASPFAGTPTAKSG